MVLHMFVALWWRVSGEGGEGREEVVADGPRTVSRERERERKTIRHNDFG